MYGIDELSKIGSEKGISDVDGKSWEKNTLFNLIDERGSTTDLAEFFGEYHYIICDDMGVEIADFIAVEENKLIAIHAKGKGNDPKVKPSDCKASAISEVCNQAIKNIHYLSMFDSSKPPKLNTWDQEYVCVNSHAGVNIKLENRRRGLAESELPNEIWEKIEEKKFNPNVEKEVWLVLGKLFSKKKFIKSLSQEKPKAVAVQALLTLQSTLASVGSMGVKLKVFCSP